MKKKILDFSKVHYYTPTRNGIAREMRNRHNRGACFKTGGVEDEDEDEDEDDAKDEKKLLLRKIKGIVSKQLEGRATAEQVRSVTDQLSFLTETTNEKGEKVKAPYPIEALRQMADDKTGVMAKLTAMGLQIQEMEARVAKKVESMDIRSQVTAWHEANKAGIEAIRNGSKTPLTPLEIRDAVTMHFSTVNSGTSPYIGTTQVEAGVNGILRFDNTFWNFVKKGRTGSKTYVWVNMTNPQGAAAFIGPGVTKPGISFELVAETSVAKKIADSAKAGTEILDDIDGMVSFIEDELREQVMEKVNATLMNSVGSSTVPTGIQQLSTTYTLTTIKTTNPTYSDAIRAVVGQMRSGKLKGDITVFINSIDAANMDLEKATDSGVYLLPPFITADGRKIGGATVVEDNNIAVGYLQAAFMKYYRVLIYKDFVVTWGWENDDFTKNLVTAVGEMRLHQFFNTKFTGAFVYDTFENVITAITQA